MDIKELRIGNLVLNKTCNGNGSLTSWIVDAILQGKKVILRNNLCTEVYKIINIQSITLTESILLKNGFKKEINYGTSYVYYVEKGNDKPIIEACIYLNEKGEFETGDDLPMTSVHQLQNYVFAKTGEELNINL